VQGASKTHHLLSFLADLASHSRKRVPVYVEGDRVLWFYDLSVLSSYWGDAYRSVFIADKLDEMPDLWLEVMKKRRPELPPVPEEIRC
jgi:hypothetical protein